MIASKNIEFDYLELERMTYLVDRPIYSGLLYSIMWNKILNYQLRDHVYMYIFTGS